MRALAAALLILLLPAGAAARPDRVYRGERTLTADTVWEGEVLVDGILTVPPGITLEIRPGTTVRFTRRDSNADGIGEHEIFVRGTFLALGTAARPVRFTSAAGNPRPGDWGAINMMVSDQDNRLRHCVVEYAYRGFHAHFARGRLEDTVLLHNLRGAQFQESTVALDRCRVLDNRNGLQFRDSTVRIADTVVRGSLWGIRCVYSEVELTGCRIENNLVNGVNLRDSQLTARGNILIGNRKGLYLQRSRGLVRGNLLLDNSEHGTLLEDSECQFTANRVGGNGRAGVRWVNSTGSLAGNDLSGNGEYALVNDGSRPLQVSGNWWGTDDPAAIGRRIRDAAERPETGPVTVSTPLNRPPALSLPVRPALD